MSKSGYSGTPLAKKLGIKAGCRLHPMYAPKYYLELLAPLPEGVTITDAFGPEFETGNSEGTAVGHESNDPP